MRFGRRGATPTPPGPGRGQAAAGPARRPRPRFPAGPFPRSTTRLRCSAGAGAGQCRAQVSAGRGARGEKGPLPGNGAYEAALPGQGRRGASRFPRGLGAPAAGARWLLRCGRGRRCFCSALTPRALGIAGHRPLRPCSALSPALAVDLT